MSGDTASRDDTQAAIMDATYRALCEHGYADLTIQTIADEFDKSKSLLYYHYDTKDEILIGLLDYLLGQFTIRVAIDPPDE
ncbi:TetR/AcrR family transcriptional regulator, partial [Halobacteriales archaeon QH_9_66_26]